MAVQVELSWDLVPAQHWEECYDVVDHCNGLLCVSCRCQKNSGVIVWNPSKEEKRLRAPDQLHVEKRREYFGFGYNSANDDYKVVLVTTFENKPAKIHSLALKIDEFMGNC
ncbi:hypothetical protein SLEP1_g38931 [Rubroshorea leprosula]|uniref:F-box associated beta-propeller type 1 domain-containing protein n=1 Tax=Rubroshorea leprosula TaxID=152421 RepID=A0AAV5KYL0_9ROSI|nr:hypothetical protein SLEP1_g38931 [Rubroshorea leprosula]